jgi:hypothetical protein
LNESKNYLCKLLLLLLLLLLLRLLPPPPVDRPSP